MKLSNKICSVEGCNGKVRAKGYCNKHYDQMRKFGKIKRTKFDPNEIIIYNDYAEIILYDQHGNERKEKGIIDLEDVEKIKEYKWCYSHGYIGCDRLGIRIHRFILDCNKNDVVDHINGNTLDNRKQNLRICSQQQNTMNNSNIRSNNTSGYKGVTWDKSKNKWTAQITVNYKNIHLGRYDKIEDAIKARQKAEIKYFGEYRRKE